MSIGSRMNNKSKGSEEVKWVVWFRSRNVERWLCGGLYLSWADANRVTKQYRANGCRAFCKQVRRSE